MPESEAETIDRTETQTVRAEAPAGGRKPPMPKGAKRAVVLLSVLCATLFLALLVVALLPRLIERDVNNLLRRMAEGGGIEFKIKAISLSSAEVACKLVDTSSGTPRDVGGIGSLSIRFSPIPLLFERTIDAVDIENCDVVADYSGGTVSVPAYNIFSRMFKKDKKEDSPPVEDLNTVIPVKVGRVSLSGTLVAEAHENDTDDILHIPYAVTLRTDPEQGWNKLDCLLKIQFATNAILGQAVYLHKEKRVRLDLGDFAFSTSSLPGAIRARLPRGLRAGISLSSKAEIDLNTFTVLDGSYIDGNFSLAYRKPDGIRIDTASPFSLKVKTGPSDTASPAESVLALTFGTMKGEYDTIPFELNDLNATVSLQRRTLRGGLLLKAAESEPAEFVFSGEMTDARSILVIVLENNPRFQVAYKGADLDLRPAGFTAGLTLDAGGLAVSADLSSPEVRAEFDGAGLKPEFSGMTAFLKPESFSAHFGMNGGEKEITAELAGGEIRAGFKGANAIGTPESFRVALRMDGEGLAASADISSPEIRAEFDGAGFKQELIGMTASVKPEAFSAHFDMNGGVKEVSAELAGGEVRAGFKGISAAANPESLRVDFRMDDLLKVISAELAGGEFKAEKGDMAASFKPESFSAGLAMADGIKGLTAELRGTGFNAGLNGLSCEAKDFTIGAVSDTAANVRDFGAIGADADNARAYRAAAEVTGFHYRQKAGGLVYSAPELALNAEYSDGIFSGDAICDDSNLSMPELKLLAQNLKWDFPFDITFGAGHANDGENGENASAAPRTGRVSLGDFEINGVQAASLDGTILWDDTARALRLRTDARLFSIEGNIHADITFGSAGLETECGIDIPEQQADLSKDLAKFFPQFEEISCTGKLGGSAVYRILPKTTTGHAKFSIAGADVFIPEKKLEVRGIGLGFEIPEIAILKSAPGQTLSFDSIKFDKIMTGPGRATFRMESTDTWQVENALLDWCNGHIRIGGVTYRIGQTTTEAVLYCDRLELPLFLTQIGLGQISGSGSINGTIPVVLVQKKDASGKTKIDNVYFEDAFLFSTPGEDGVIKGELDEAITNAESGIEMELSKDALKDFTYSWVRMRMISSGPEKENLKLELQLDGRPNRALYYSFNEKTASFIKSPTPCIFQGIRLDTNVNMYGKAMELVDYFQQIFSRGD